MKNKEIEDLFKDTDANASKLVNMEPASDHRVIGNCSG